MYFKFQAVVPSYGCVIGEMGVRDHNDKPYPSTGFTSVYVMAHEIGHNLGMLDYIVEHFH